MADARHLPILARDAAESGRRVPAVAATAGGAAFGVLAGGGLAGAAALAAVGWLGAVTVGLARRRLRRRPPAIDPFALRDPWRRYVQRALQAQSRFRQSVSAVAAGPLRTRLEGVGSRLDRGVVESWDLARRGQRLEDVRRQIDVRAVRDELTAVEGEGPATPGSSVARTAEALRSQLATAERLDVVLAASHERLRLLDAGLDEAVARSLELSVRTGDPEGLEPVGTAFQEVLEEMEALRQAMDEADPPSAR